MLLLLHSVGPLLLDDVHPGQTVEGGDGEAVALLGLRPRLGDTLVIL